MFVVCDVKPRFRGFSVVSQRRQMTVAVSRRDNFFGAQCPPSGSLIHPPHVCLSVSQGWTRSFSPFGGKLQRKNPLAESFGAMTWMWTVFQRLHRNIGLSLPERATNQRPNFTKSSFSKASVTHQQASTQKHRDHPRTT